MYGLRESRHTEYFRRTAQNIRHADATIVFTAPDVPGINSKGSRFTVDECTKQGKPCLVVRLVVEPAVYVSDIREFITTHGITVLNIAGNRESVAPGIGKRVEGILMEALKRD